MNIFLQAGVHLDNINHDNQAVKAELFRIAMDHSYGFVHRHNKFLENLKISIKNLFKNTLYIPCQENFFFQCNGKVFSQTMVTQKAWSKITDQHSFFFQFFHFCSKIYIYLSTKKIWFIIPGSGKRRNRVSVQIICKVCKRFVRLCTISVQRWILVRKEARPKFFFCFD